MGRIRWRPALPRLRVRAGAMVAFATLEADKRDFVLKIASGHESEVIKRLDVLLDPYGGQAAYGRKDLPSHAWGEHGLDMLRNMSRTMPTIFLVVAAFLINQWLNRMVALEREQIGLLKALGYTPERILKEFFAFDTFHIEASHVLFESSRAALQRSRSAVRSALPRGAGTRSTARASRPAPS